MAPVIDFLSRSSPLHDLEGFLGYTIGLMQFFSDLEMGKCKGSGKLGRMQPRDGSVSAYHFSLLLSPVVSVWDCIVRKMRYSYRPEWV
ncbi:hypothetical protein CUMW_091050 [Citrus unshiu]|nr:hypothetical protein CUMW_091050 [Citrus unshiu]